MRKRVSQAEKADQDPLARQQLQQKPEERAKNERDRSAEDEISSQGPQLGKKRGNTDAAALEQLGYATTMEALNTSKARAWLDDMPSAPKIHFKDVAATLARWLARGAKEPVEHLSHELWG